MRFLLTAILGIALSAYAADPPRNLAVVRASAPATEQKVALVIGNAKYKTSPLQNPGNDARAMAAKLRSLGFEVILREDLGAMQVGAALREFRAKLQPGAIALFFYAGHGLQVRGVNYLPTVDADIASEEDVPRASLNVNEVLSLMDEAKTRLNLVFLDACRNNPYARSFRSAAGGLAKVEAPSGTLISFATRPGSVAADGDGKNGLYTSQLLTALDQPGLAVEQVLKRVVSGVRQASNGRQEPWMEGSIEGEFYFRAPPTDRSAVSGTVLPPANVSADQMFWDGVKDSGQRAEYLAYMERFPNGQFISLAQTRVERIYSKLADLVLSQTPSNRGLSNDHTKSGLPTLWNLAAPGIKERAQAGQMEELIATYRTDAQAGDAVAQLSFGNAFYAGLGVTVNFGEAFKWFKRAADQGYAAAQYSLGAAYMYGNGTGTNPSEAIKWYRKAADQGMALAEAALGFAYMNGAGTAKDEVEAVKWYRRAAAQGLGSAQTSLGIAYAYGTGVGKDRGEALKWFIDAADQGLPDAQYNLGAAFEDGLGVVKDEAEAVKWYRRAADQGYAAAQNALGLAYEHGNGVGKDEAEAIKWYRKAADQGFDVAQYYLGAAYQSGSGIGKDEAEAVKWFRKAADQGYAAAQNALGYAYLNGRGIGKDETEAVKWYRKAADQANATAQYAMGYCYENGSGVSKDLDEAVSWYRKAAAQGQVNAKTSLEKLAPKQPH